MDKNEKSQQESTQVKVGQSGQTRVLDKSKLLKKSHNEKGKSQVKSGQSRSTIVEDFEEFDQVKKMMGSGSRAAKAVGPRGVLGRP